MSGYIGTQPVPQATQTRETFTATAGQTTFNTGGYQAGYLSVFLNGVKLVSGTDYTATNGSDVVLLTGASAGDTLETVAYTAFTVADQTFTGNIVMADGLTVDNDGATVLTVDRATSDGTIIDVQKNGTTVGSIGVNNTDNITLSGNSTHSGLMVGTDNIVPYANGSTADGTEDLGYSSIRWRNLYLSGGVYLGGTGSANYLDDYEEGTWTPTVQGTTTAGTSTYSTREASYVKIGRQVTVTCNTVLTSFSGAAGNAVVTGLPFAAASGFGVATGAFECDNVAFSSGYTTAYVTVFGGQSQVSYRQHGSSRTEAPINVTQVPAGNWQRFSITYFTDA